MLPALLRDVRLFRLLVALDREVAHTFRQDACRRCGGRLDQSTFERKPRGLPSVQLKEDYSFRESYCCRDCRLRHTPPSLRFLGRRLYVGAIVVLVSAMVGGITEKRAAELRKMVGVSMRTLRRWRTWWRETFIATSFWRGARGQLTPPPPDPRKLPASLLERFAGPQPRDRLVACLRFLAPITSRSGCAKAG